MRKVEIIAFADNTFIESLYCQIGNHTYLTGDKITEPIVRDGCTLYTAEKLYSSFLEVASTYNSIDIKPIKGD